MACDFLETITLTGTRMFVLALIEHRTRRIRVLGAIAYPCASFTQSMGRTGAALDNAVAEAFNSTLEFELSRSSFATRAQARRPLADWIDEYNTLRRHSAAHMMAPVDYELARHTIHTAQSTAAGSPSGPTP